MKSIIILTFLFYSQFSLADTQNYNCSYEDILDIASFKKGSSKLKERSLSSQEQIKLENAFDDEYDCGEGVQLKGTAKTEQGADYLATCWKDSLGSATVSLELNCVQE